MLLGACISTAGTPSGVPTQFTPAEIETLLANGGRIYLGSALTVIAASLVLIIFFEVRYRGCCTPAPSVGTHPPLPAPREAPRWLTGLMVFLYPGALGLDESVADCGVRAFSAMLVSGVEPWGEGVFWLMLVVGVTCACATSVWLAAVYRTYETTVALPIEYGALNVCSVMAGLLFYDEARYMSRWQLGLVLGGTGIVMLGIAMSLRSTLKDVVMTRRGSIHLDTPRGSLPTIGLPTIHDNPGGRDRTMDSPGGGGGGGGGREAGAAISPGDVRTAGAIPGIGGSDREAHAAHAAAHGLPATATPTAAIPATGGAAPPQASSQASTAPSSTAPSSATAPSSHPNGAAGGVAQAPVRSSCEC